MSITNHTNPDHEKNILQSDVHCTERCIDSRQCCVDGSLDGRRHCGALSLEDELCYRKQTNASTAAASVVRDVAAVVPSLKSLVYQKRGI